MSNFREAQRQAHPTKTNTLLFALLCLSVNLWCYHRRASPTYC